MQFFQQINDLLDSGSLEISIENELNIGGIIFIDSQFTMFIPLKAITGASVVFRFTGRGAVPQTQFDVIAASLIFCLIECLNDRKDMFRGRISGIIAFVRQQAIGSALISHESRIKHAFARIRQEHTFNQNQLNWLARIEKTMLEEPVLDESLFDQGAYRTNGGFNAINKRFGGTLRAIIQEINQYIYDDGGSVA